MSSGSETETTFSRDGISWTVPSGCVIGRSLYVYGHYQDEALTKLKAYFPKDKTIAINIGANIGDMAIPLALSGWKVLAVEPNPSTYNLLRKNISQNSLEERIVPIEGAISFSNSFAELAIPYQPGNSELVVTEKPLGFSGVDVEVRRATVKTWRLDDLLVEYEVSPRQVGLVLSDTQGHESAVIETGDSIWSTGGLAYVEVWPKGLDSHGGVETFIRACEKRFSHMLRIERLTSTKEPIEELSTVISTLPEFAFTDVLLFPKTCAR